MRINNTQYENLSAATICHSFKMRILSYSETDVIVSRHCLVSNGGFFILIFLLIGKNAKASG